MGKYNRNVFVAVAYETNTVTHLSFSIGCNYKFKMRHEVSIQVASGESRDVAGENVDKWFKACPTKLMHNNCLPMLMKVASLSPHAKQKLTLKGDICNGGKHLKDRFTVLFCTNAQSENMTPLITSKAHKPGYFKNSKTLPVTYETNTEV